MEKSVEQNFTSDKWRVATTADWSYWCSMFLMSASFRTIELWPSAPIYKQRDAEQLLQQLLERPGASISLSKPQPASIYCLFIQKKKIPQNQKRWPLQLFSNSAASPCTRQREGHAQCPTPSLTGLATHLMLALHRGGAAHMESEPNPVERTWVRDDTKRNKELSYQQLGLKSASIS